MDENRVQTHRSLISDNSCTSLAEPLKATQFPDLLYIEFPSVLPISVFSKTSISHIYITFGQHIYCQELVLRFLSSLMPQSIISFSTSGRDGIYDMVRARPITRVLSLTIFHPDSN